MARMSIPEREFDKHLNTSMKRIFDPTSPFNEHNKFHINNMMKDPFSDFEKRKMMGGSIKQTGMMTQKALEIVRTQLETQIKKDKEAGKDTKILEKTLENLKLKT